MCLILNTKHRIFKVNKVIHKIGLTTFIPFESRVDAYYVNCIQFSDKKLQPKLWLGKLSVGTKFKYDMKFAKPYYTKHEKLVDDFLRVSFEIYGYGIYRYHGFLLDLAGTYRTGYFYIDENGIFDIDEGQIIIKDNELLVTGLEIETVSQDKITEMVQEAIAYCDDNVPF